MPAAAGLDQWVLRLAHAWSSRRAQKDEQLQRRMARIHGDSRETYGSPKIHQQLRHEGLRCGRNRVIRLMRQLKLAVKRRRCFKRTTQRNPARVAAPNLLNQVWLAEMGWG
jgi:putative transposase